MAEKAKKGAAGEAPATKKSAKKVTLTGMKADVSNGFNNILARQDWELHPDTGNKEKVTAKKDGDTDYTAGSAKANELGYRRSLSMKKSKIEQTDDATIQKIYDEMVSYATSTSLDEQKKNAAVKHKELYSMLAGVSGGGTGGRKNLELTADNLFAGKKG